MTGTLIVHAAWTGGLLHLWGESDRGWSDAGSPLGAEVSELEDALASLGITGRAGSVRVRLPEAGGRRLPSAEMAHAIGRSSHEFNADEVTLRDIAVASVAVGPGSASAALERLDETTRDSEGVIGGASVSYLAMLARFARHLLVRQRFVPMARQDGSGKLTGAWRAWMGDEHSTRRADALARAMPPVVRAVVDETRHDSWTILEEFVGALVDAGCRRTLLREEMIDTIEGQDTNADPQVAWLTGLLGGSDEAPIALAQRTEASRRIKRWIGALEERGQSSSWRLGFRLNEPLDEHLPADMEDTSGAVGWSVSFYLQSQEDPRVRVEAADVWLLSRDRATIEGYSLDSPQELLLGELGRASRLFKRLESALSESEPIDIDLSTNQAYEFLREIRPVLVEQGFGVEAPGWWESPVGRLGARLRIESGAQEPEAGAGGAAGSSVGLTTLVGYHWEIAIGETTLTLHEFERFASRSSPLVRVGGQWVEIRPEDVQSAIRFIRENPGGEMALSDAMRMAYATDQAQTGVPVVGMEASGWVARLLGGSDTARVELPVLTTPVGFHGTLRPYQERGFSWLWFLQRFGLGACLADDMGLGKTIQLLALLLFEREEGERTGEAVDPTLLVVPMSVVGNWMHESKRFAPSLKVLVHHGVERLTGDALVDEAEASDVIVTTYALAHRDRETLGRIRWGRVVLDEAQFIKNPAAKQAQAVRAIEAPRRVALTGTPVENRLSELWSIMDFLNPGFLGTIGSFRKKFAAPIERYHDQAKSDRLKSLVQPFILRRVKTDPNVAADLPEKLESKEYCHLTSEQAQLYESCVKRMLSDIDQSEGIQRRGVVLAALIRLKQICNHPSQMLKDHEPTSRRPADPRRSGKCIRLLEQLDEALSEGDRALVFTQFRQMGHLLASILRHELGREILFLHGGTPQGARQSMVEKFQSGESDAPVLILSLKAGGVGLNLTAATHVFHYDRWWNPAVENQATDRAYRIGQTRTVQVHKYVVRGTLEERIDEMIESKMELAENIIGSGERWLTELDSDQLKDILTLRADAVGDEE